MLWIFVTTLFASTGNRRYDGAKAPTRWPVANNESFIDEVNDEVRRERLYASLRRYGWIGIVVVLLIVGGASFNEYRKATARAEAEAFGDAVLTALETSAPSARATALRDLDVEGNAARTAVLTLLAAGTADGEASEAELAQLDALAQNVELSSAYRDLAAFGSVMLQGDTLDPAERIAKLQPLAIPGSPYALLALSLIHI